MNVTKAYQNHVVKATADIKANFEKIGGASSWIAAQDKANCPNSMEGNFLVTGENSYRANETHLTAALVRIHCVRNAHTVWHVKEDGKKSRVLTTW